MSKSSRSEPAALPRALYRAEDVRALDRIAIDSFRIPGITLMERAGAAAFASLRGHWPNAKRVVVAAGVGNNAGDGYVIARLAADSGFAVDLWQVGDSERLHGDALTAFNAMRARGVHPGARGSCALSGADVIVDGLFGTGLDREVTGAFADAIAAINEAGRPTLAVDIPSGLNADTGAVMGRAVRADATVTFIGLKQGLFTGDGRQYAGTIEYCDLDIPAAVYAAVPASARRTDVVDLEHWLPPRPRHAHKGHFGHVLVLGGDLGYAGAARLCAESSARVGAGLVSVATRVQHATAITATRPELMSHAVETAEQLRPLLGRASVVAVGPGLGQSAWAAELFGALLEGDIPLVVDADALNLLAFESYRRDRWILTPHPGEAARLLKSTTAAVQRDRFTAARRIHDAYGGICVLKGSGSLVIGLEGEPVSVCTGGNPGMASGGMGDVLTGLIAGLVAQGLSLYDAAQAGVTLHAEAADRAARADGERGLLASDLLPWIRALANPLAS